MRFFSRCEACKHRKLIISKRVYNVEKVGIITSKGHLCYRCYLVVKKLAVKLN